jgi:hypothetical protein
VGYFLARKLYSSFSDTAKQDAAGMLRTLLLQMSNQLTDGHIALGRLHSSDAHKQELSEIAVLWPEAKSSSTRLGREGTDLLSFLSNQS